jgi:hypothetical protein
MSLPRGWTTTGVASTTGFCEALAFRSSPASTIRAAIPFAL